ncbi:hypothetical protein MHY1_02636 [Methylovirgula sp. HY1]|nr:hypothetical protein MHY1_02636 [Methylovirgula sp. HY1]
MHSLGIGLRPYLFVLSYDLWKRPATFPEHARERFPIGWTPPIERKPLQINKLEHALIGKVIQLFRNML